MSHVLLPKTILGRWVAVSPEPIPPACAVIIDATIVFFRDGVEAGKHPVHVPPKNSWGAAVEELVVSPSGRWIWHIGHGSDGPLVTLFDGGTFAVLGTFTPEDQYGDGGRLAAWGEMEASVSPARDDVCLIRANVGDSFVTLYTLQATAAGILNPTSPTLYGRVRDCLDEVLWFASMVTADRFLIVDDIGIATLFSWPDARKVRAFYLRQSLGPDTGGKRLFEEDEPTSLMFGESIGIFDDLFLLPVIEHGWNSYPLLGHVGFNPRTLAPLGRVRPPPSVTEELHPLYGDRFCVGKNTATQVRFERAGNHTG
ncbi:MAG: hypothetical protein AAFV53_42145 [Myxococcota bacterium]